MAWTPVVVVNGLEAVREALVHRGEDTSDRPGAPVYEHLGFGPQAQGKRRTGRTGRAGTRPAATPPARAEEGPGLVVHSANRKARQAEAWLRSGWAGEWAGPCWERAGQARAGRNGGRGGGEEGKEMREAGQSGQSRERGRDLTRVAESCEQRGRTERGPSSWKRLSNGRKGWGGKGEWAEQEAGLAPTGAGLLVPGPVPIGGGRAPEQRLRAEAGPAHA